MVVSVLTTRSLTRLFRRPIRKCLHYRNITGNTAAANVEVNRELLNSFNRDIKSGGVVPVFRRALLFPTRIAVQDDVGIYTYAGLHQVAASLSNEISAQLLGETERTIAYMCGNDASHVIVQWAIWMSGNIAVPLTSLHPPEMLKYFIQDSSAALVICTPEYEKTMRPVTLEVSVPLMTTGRDKELTAQLYQPNSTFLNMKPEESLTDVGRSNEFYGNSEAMLIYTSGTTSKPKGVVWTHGMLAAQIAALHAAWRYSAGDVVLHTLPLHHIHGQLNSLNASLAAGARVRMLGGFVPHVVWARLLGMGERDEARPTVLHGVPAMYARLSGERERLFGGARQLEYVRAALRRLRLACAGSAPLPQRVADGWEEISGQRLLERYGMSEVGMALSNPYRPVEERTVGCVGNPLPGVGARIAAVHPDTGELEPLVTVVTPEPEYQICLLRLGLTAGQESPVESDGYEWKPPTVTRHKESADGVYQGELLLKGPGVFTRYWNRVASLNASDFTPDGWFRTGDTVSYADNKFRILGRTSIDIIKTGGYKVSALQVESAVSEHPSVADVAVLGVEHEDFGETVTAVVQLHKGASLTLRELKDDAGKRLAPYQLPRNLLIVDQMPRNAMGKLDKKEIRKLYGKELAMKAQ